MKNKTSNLLKKTAILLFGLMVMPLSAAEPEAKALPDKLPEDFKLEYRSKDVGVIPSGETIITLEKTGEVYLYNQIRKHDAEQCLALYRKAVALGFFNLKDRYAPDEVEFGGAVMSMSLTADGVTKTVSVSSGAKVPVIDQLLQAMQGMDAAKVE